MLKYTRNEQGYTLILTFAILILFTLLGFTLLTMTMNGAAKNSNRQNIVSAQDLAEKGASFMVNELQLTLQNFIAPNGVLKNIGKAQFKERLEQLVNNRKYQCDNRSYTSERDFANANGIIFDGDKGGKTLTCIESVKNVSNEEKDAYRKIVTLKSLGFVNGKLHTIYNDVIIGTDAVPDQLRYAASTNDQGDLFLHGGVEIQGDIKTDGNLILSDYATWGSTTWQASVPARLVKDNKSVTSKIIMNNNARVFTLDTSSFNSYATQDNTIRTRNGYNYIYGLYNYHVTGQFLQSSWYNSYSPNNVNDVKKIQNSFFDSDNIAVIPRKLPDDKVDINEIFKQLKGRAKTSLWSNVYATSRDDIFYLTGTECYRRNCYFSDNVREHMNIQQDMNLRGTYLVNGDVKIGDLQSRRTLNINSDAILYVNGDVEIRNSILNGINKDSTLIIFATGNIDISNISVDKDTSSKIKGFFYSKKNFLMYGVGSNIELHGGISAKRLILTGVRGRSSNYTYDSAATQRNRDARLKIIYDEKLIESFTSFLRDKEEEFITELSPPEILERR